MQSGKDEVGIYKNMLKVIPRILFNYLSCHFNYISTLPASLTFSVSYKCNFRCKTCNIWKDCNIENELDLSQIDKIFHSLGKSLYWVTLDGGEPFLRRNLAEICELIYKNCKPTIINIPSNGSLTEQTISCVERILQLCPDTNLIINLSLDHIAEKHDAIRGFQGAFNCLLNTYKGLRYIKHPLLRVGINTVVSDYNIKDLEIIQSFVRDLKPDSHLFEVAQLRDEFRNKDFNNIVPQEQDTLLLLQQLSKSTGIVNNSAIGKCLHIIRRHYYSLIEENFVRKQQNTRCFAGTSSAYILPDGKVWACCNHDWLMGDLKEYDFNFNAFWNNKTARSIRQYIKENKCFCMQANANYLNLLHSPKHLAKISCDILFS